MHALHISDGVFITMSVAIKRKDASRAESQMGVLALNFVMCKSMSLQGE